MPPSNFSPLPTQPQWESELRLCYKTVPRGFESSNAHLFIRKSIHICNLRINAVICGFEESNKLFKTKLESLVVDEFYEGFRLDFEFSEDEESDGPLDGFRCCTDAEKLTLRTNFLMYNISIHERSLVADRVKILACRVTCVAQRVFINILNQTHFISQKNAQDFHYTRHVSTIS